MNEDGRRPDEPEATPESTSPEVFLNVPAIVGRPTILEFCDFIKRDTARVLLQADDIGRTAEFFERVWRDELSRAIGEARDLATVERLWAA